MGIFLIFISVCTNLVEGMLVKIQGKKTENGIYIFNGLIAAFSMLFFVITNIDGFCYYENLIWYVLPSAVMYCTALVCTYKALSCGSFAISMLIISYSIVLPIIYGIVFLNEPVNMTTYLAFAVVAVSLYLSRGDTSGEQKGISAKWLFYIGVSTIGNGLFAVVKKIQQLHFNNSCNNEFMIFTLGITAVFLLIFGVCRKEGRYISVRMMACAVGSGIFNGITNMLTLIINTMVALSVSSPINTGLKIVLSFVISGVLLKEKFLKRQIAGVGLGAIALILLSV